MQMAKWRKLPEDIQRCDITFMSKDPFLKKNFAPPTYDLIRKMKQNEISSKTYKEIYLDHLHKNLEENEKEWIQFLSQDKDVALLCFCTEGVFCHRFVLGEFLEEVADAFDLTVSYKGDYQSD